MGSCINLFKQERAINELKGFLKDNRGEWFHCNNLIDLAPKIFSLKKDVENIDYRRMHRILQAFVYNDIVKVERRYIHGVLGGKHLVNYYSFNG